MYIFLAYNISLNIFFGLQCVIFLSILFQKNYFLLSSFVICFPRHHHFQQNFQQAHNSLMDSKACTLSLHHQTHTKQVYGARFSLISKQLRKSFVFHRSMIGHPSPHPPPPRFPLKAHDWHMKGYWVPFLKISMTYFQ